MRKLTNALRSLKKSIVRRINVILKHSGVIQDYYTIRYLERQYEPVKLYLIKS